MIANDLMKGPMKITMFDTHTFERESFALANKKSLHEITHFEPRTIVMGATQTSNIKSQ
jgi:hypothetical protein